MENPIRANELFDENLINQLSNFQNLLGGLKDGIQDLAANLKQTGSASSGTATDVTQLVTSANALKNAFDAATNMMKENANALNVVTSATKKAADSSSEYNKTLQKHADQQLINQKVTKLINDELKTSELSYNELTKIYSAMSSRLKNLSKDQIESIEGMQRFAAVTKQVRDGMNEAQKAMGNYSLNVGKYHTAFDGLGFSIQQVLREVPSSTNISQFFLAISNNIPQVVDQMKLFNEEQANIKKQLSQLTVGTKEYMEVQSKQISLGTKVVKSIFSWQTAILAGLLLLRKLPEIIEKINGKIGNAVSWLKMYKEVNEGAASEVGSLTAKFEGLRKEWGELGEEERVKWVNTHKDALKDLGIELNNVNDAEMAFEKDTSSVIEAINKRARSIAAMKIASEKYAEAFKKTSQADAIMKDPWANVSLWDFAKGMAGNYNSSKGGQDIEKELQKRYDKLIEEAKKLENEAYNLIDTYYDPLPQEEGGGKNGRKAKTPTLQNVEDRYWEAMQARLEILEEGYTKELELARLANQKALYDNDQALQRQTDALAENLKNRFITQKEYDEQMKNAQADHDAIALSLTTQFTNKEQELLKKHHEELLDMEIERTEVTLRNTKRRIRTLTEEGSRNDTVMRNINDLQLRLIELEELKAKEWQGEEEKIKKAIEETNKELEKQRGLLNFDKQLANLKNKDFGKMLGDKIRDGFFDKFNEENADGSGSGTDHAIKILGALGFDEEQLKEAGEETVMGVFEKMIDIERENLKEWYGMTTEYINDAISAWQDLSQAKIDAAKEDVDIAEEAYEKEKALLEAGYANNIDTAYKELEEKRKIQKQAEEDAKKAQKVQEAMDTAQQVSSLVTGIANIWKSFSTLPVVATALTATMLAAFTTSKALAFSAVNTKKYGEGGYEPVFGGSHASGSDVALNMGSRDGSRMVVEGGEGIGIFSHKAVSYYGNNGIEGFVAAVNRREYERGSIDVLRKREALVKGTVASRRPGISLSKVEGALDAIRMQGENGRMIDAEGNIIVMHRNGQTKYIRR